MGRLATAAMQNVATGPNKYQVGSSARLLCKSINFVNNISVMYHSNIYIDKHNFTHKPKIMIIFQHKPT